MNSFHAAPTRRIWRIFCFLPVGIAALLPLAVRAAETTVTIGFAAPLSGPYANMGRSMEHAVELALNEANSSNLRIAGNPVVFKLLSQDDRADARTAALVADYMVKAGSIAVVGHFTTATSLSAAPVYNNAGIVQVSPSATGRQLTLEGYGNLFRVVGHDDDTGMRASQYALQTLHAKRIAVIDDGTVYGTMLSQQFIKNLTQNQVQVLARHTISNNTSDFNTVVADLREKKPDLVFFGGLAAQTAALQLSLKRNNINTRLMAAGSIISSIYLDLTGTASEGTLGIAGGVPQETMTGWKKFKEKFVATYGNDLQYYAPFAYDATNVIIAAIRQSGSLDPKRLSETLHKIKYRGLTGAISFDAQGNLNAPTHTVFEVKQGKWVAMQSFGGK